DMAILDWWADYPDADNFLYPLFHTASFGPGGNYSFYSDQVTDSLILVARPLIHGAPRDEDQRVGHLDLPLVPGGSLGRPPLDRRLGRAGDLQWTALDEG